jgi:hypothetical protein
VSLTSTATGQEKRAQIGLFTVEFKAIGIGRSAAHPLPLRSTR